MKRWLSLVTVGAVVVVLCFSLAGAADKTELDKATKQVSDGAKQIGAGELGSGFSDFFVGIGSTIVEGTVYTGKTIGEFFKKTFSS